MTKNEDSLMKKSTEIWNECLTIIKDNIPEEAYNTWFKPALAVSYKDNVFVLQVPSQFFIEQIESTYIDLLRKALHRVLGVGVRLEYRVLIDQATNTGTVIPASEPPLRPVNGQPRGQAEAFSPYNKIALPELDPQLSPSFNFNNLIEGRSNRLAITAGKSIASNPGQQLFNPLFVFGKSGVGKTHLANAIGVMTKQLFPEKRVLYLSANTFQIQYTDAVRSNSQNDFLNFYQTIDVLIIDDIQDFARKQGTQNTFFHIFNHLHQSGKQLILTSDRAPSELNGLEDRLLTRFKWGLPAEIEHPDFELRKAILQDKIYRNGIEIAEEVVDFIAENVDDNVRDLEGVLQSLIAHSTMVKDEVNLDLAETVISRIVNTSSKKEDTVGHIQDVVCKYYNLTVEDVNGTSRKASLVNARQVAMYFARKYTEVSLAKIGEQIGGKNHATVVHACTKVDDMIETDKNYRKKIEEIDKLLKKR